MKLGENNMALRDMFDKARNWVNSLKVPDYTDQQFWEINDYWFQQECNDPEHNPPSHMMVPQKSTHQHTCPTCGKVQYVRNSSNPRY